LTQEGVSVEWNDEKKKSLTFLAAGVLCLAAARISARHLLGTMEEPPLRYGRRAGPVDETDRDALSLPGTDICAPAEWVLYVTGAVRSPGV
jgi:hypothetical protein